MSSDPLCPVATTTRRPELHLLSSPGRPHHHHVPRGTRRGLCGVLWTEQEECGDHQLHSSSHEKVQEVKVKTGVCPPVGTSTAALLFCWQCIYFQSHSSRQQECIKDLRIHEQFHVAALVSSVSSISGAKNEELPKDKCCK